MGYLSLYITALVNSFKAQFRNRDFFDLTTPDPEFPGFTVRPEDQLPGRPVEGKIAIDRFFTALQLFVIEAQQKADGTSGSKVYDELKERKLPVLGPNVGQFLFEHQDLIPVEFRGKVALIFWGKVYRGAGVDRCVRCLVWVGERWIWHCGWVDYGGWFARGQAVMLASSPSVL